MNVSATKTIISAPAWKKMLVSNISAEFNFLATEMGETVFFYRILLSYQGKMHYGKDRFENKHHSL